MRRHGPCASWKTICGHKPRQLSTPCRLICTSREKAAHARVRWLFSLLYLCGLRISEVVHSTMGYFFYRRNKAGDLRWWLEVTGKGATVRLVPATSELMVELARYRCALGLSALPREHDGAPLLFPVMWHTPADGAIPIDWPHALARAAVQGIVKGVIDDATLSLLARGDEFGSRAERMRAAYARWLRHARGSYLPDDIDLRHVRDTLGHASISTTSIFLHAEEDQRHLAASGGQQLGWEA